MCEVFAVISCQQVVFNGWDRAHVNRGTLKQVIEKEQKEHEERCVKGLANETPFI